MTLASSAPASTICKLLASERGRVFSVPRCQAQTRPGKGRAGLALSLELPERVPWRPKCLSEATAGADLAKSAAWALQSPKPSVGGCDPARLGALARLSGRPGWSPPGPRPERGAQLGHVRREPPT